MGSEEKANAIPLELDSGTAEWNYFDLKDNKGNPFPFVDVMGIDNGHIYYDLKIEDKYKGTYRKNID